MTRTLGKLVNASGDTAALDRTAEGYFKQFVGGDRMYFDRKGIPGIEATPTARLVMSFNTRPRWVDRSDGIWRRLLLLPFRVQIPEEKRDKKLLMAGQPDWPFRVELPAIFRWAIQGLHRLRQRGHFTEPAVCKAALEEYRRESNPARMFLDECCTAAAEGKTAKGQLYERYRTYCQDNGYSPLANNKFGVEVKQWYEDQGIEYREERPRAEKGKPRPTYYMGIQLADEKAIVSEIQLQPALAAAG